MFTQAVIKQCVDVAKKLLVEPAAMLAVVEVESRGRAFEADNYTPIFLFERHKFYEWLQKRRPEKLQQAIDAGLAIPNWDRANQYKDLGTSKGRKYVLDRAVYIDKECAYLACSWGVGQIMGFNAQSIGYSSAIDMVTRMCQGGIPAQVEAMFRFIRWKKLIDEVNSHDWASFALQYNGRGYKQNQYDVKMASAYEKWRRALDDRLPETGTETDTEVDMPEPSQQPENPAPPATDIVKTKTFWMTLVSAFSAVMATLSNPVVQVFFLCIVVAAGIYVIYERRQKQREALL